MSEEYKCCHHATAGNGRRPFLAAQKRGSEMTLVTHLLLFWFSSRQGVTWFVPPWHTNKRALERQEILAN
jgi:hypothetical protein